MTSDATNSQPVNDVNLGDLRGEIKTRWIRTSVEMFEHPSLNFGPYDRRSAWMWLIANAAWKEREINHKGARLVLERGQVLIGRKFLAEKWGWTEQKVRTFVLRLCEDDMLEINQSNGHFANIATICNYEKYQTAQPERGQSNNQSLTSQQPEPNQTLTSNTNTTNNNSISSVCGDTARESAALTTEDLKILQAKLVAAALPGLVDEVNRQGMVAIPEPLGWLKAGADLELDILPALAATAAKAAAKGRRISNWSYFSNPVAEAVAARKSGAQTVSAASAKAKTPATSTFYHPPKKSEEQENREREAWAREMGIIDEHVH